VTGDIRKLLKTLRLDLREWTVWAFCDFTEEERRARTDAFQCLDTLETLLTTNATTSQPPPERRPETERTVTGA
jgi:hypothetical protein